MLFGSKESKIAKLIKKGKWEILSKKYLHADTETKKILAKECGKANDPGVNSLLSTLLRDSDRGVRFEAVKALTITGKDHEVAQLQWVLSQTPADDKEMLEAVEKAIANCRGRR